MDDLGLFLVAVPGLEGPLEAEARAMGLDGVRPVPGGVEARGDLAEAARVNRLARCAVRVLSIKPSLLLIEESIPVYPD